MDIIPSLSRNRPTTFSLSVLEGSGAVPWEWVATGVALALALVLLIIAWRRWWRRALLARRFRRGYAGELAAEELLRRRGYQIAAIQKSMSLQIVIDGQAVDYEVRPDALVRKRGRLYLVEVKTGDVAIDPLYGHTRRQLFEYYHALPVDGVLLVNPELGRIHDIRFHTARSGYPLRGRSVWWFLLAGLLVGAAMAAMALR